MAPLFSVALWFSSSSSRAPVIVPTTVAFPKGRIWNIWP
jgi:hypothetical protein